VEAVNGLRPRVDFVITGGDLVSDTLAADYPRAKLLWDLYEDVCKDFEMPVHNVIGNHDVLGWSKRSPVRLDHPQFGKRMFKDRLGRRRTYRSFDYRGWHFILLDSVGCAEDGRGYVGLIGEKQVAWLQEDLRRVGTRRPIVVVTHIPFFSVWFQMHYGPHANPPKKERFYIKNAHQLRKLLAPHNVKLILQGHLHVNERIVVSDLTYITTGAVCGNQWKGPRFGEFPEGYGVITIRGDRFEYAYRTYGWKAPQRG
jgi:3',5'-cyclic AMP phosphodiesterase CpdA